MKQPTSYGKKPAKSRRETREELNQSARDRKRQKKHRGNAPGSRAGATQQGAAGKNASGSKDPRIGSKKPVELGAKSAPVKAPQVEKKVPLSPREELDKLESDDRLDGLLERLENGETLSADEQSWVDAQLDRIDELMQQLGISYDDDEEDDEEQQEDMMRLLRGGK